jgi:hypothetical protein
MAELKGELARERSLSGKVQETDAYTRSFLVKAGSLSDSLIAISNAPGIKLKDAHPENAAIKAMEYDVKCVDDSGLLYQVDFKYYAPPPDLPQDAGGLPAPGTIEGFGKKPIWTAGSSVTTGPVTKDITGQVISNSAGDPYEDITKEFAEFRLGVTMYAFFASDWITRARLFTNAINADTWHGGEPGTWKCQGCSAQLVTESLNGSSYTLWEINWEFAYRADKWNLQLIDVGYAERVDENGEYSQNGNKRRAIRDPKGKPVPGPVPLNGMGGAAEPGTVVTNLFDVYASLNFGGTFGEIYP